MPPSRFAASVWRNFLVSPLQDEHRKQTGLGSSTLLCASDVALYGVDSAGTSVVRVGLDDGNGDAGGSHGAGGPASSTSSVTRKVGGATGGTGSISALALSPFAQQETQDGGDILAVGSQQGGVRIVRVSGSGAENDGVVAEYSSSGSGAGAGATAAVEFHPHVAGLLLAGTASQGVHIARFDGDGAARTVSDFGLDDKVNLHSAAWNPDGTVFATTASDQKLALWDPRTGGASSVGYADGTHGAAKLRPTRLVYASASLILTTGFNAGRQREWAVWDVRALGSAVHRSSVPSSSTTVLTPLADVDRALVYLHGKGDASMQVVDLSLQPFTAKATPLPAAATAMALSPLLRPPHRAMKGEIAKVYLNTPTNDAVVPLSVTIPRRQYLDFHEDLFPPTYAPFPASWDVDEWLKKSAGDVKLERQKISQDPARRQAELDSARQKAGVTDAAIRPTPAASTSIPQAEAAPVDPAPTVTTAPTTTSAVSSSPTPSSATGPASAVPDVPQVTDASTTLPPPQRNPPRAQTASDRSEPTASSSSKAVENDTSYKSPALSSASGATSRPATTTPSTLSADWSRRFLTGSTPLLPELNNVGGISTSLPAEARLLGVTIAASGSSQASTEPRPGYLVFPLAGPGGRLGIHPLTQPGRFPVLADIPALDSGTGTAIIDFAPSPFLSPDGQGGGEVYVLSADAKIRKWALPAPPPLLPADCLPLGPTAKRQPTSAERDASAVRVPERPECVLDGSASIQGGRIVQVEPHPLIRGLVAALVAGPPARLLIWSEEPGQATEIQPALEVDIGPPETGAFTFGWSLDGRYVAIACKDKKMRVGDVRAIATGSATWIEVAAHDSPRAFKLAWLSNTHLVSTGHGAGSVRQLKLYELTLGEGTIKTLETLQLDANPAVLWPWWDPDTRILFLYAGGERAVNAYEVRLPGSSPAPATTAAASAPRRFGAAAAALASTGSSAFLALPAFGHANPQQALAFLTKRQLDVRACEVAAAYLFSLSSKGGEIQRVGWSITRARPEFFQDDIFVDTEAVEEPVDTDARAWLAQHASAGAASAPAPARRKVSLCPPDMIPLSQAPPPSHKLGTSTLAKGPTIRAKTDKEKEDAFLDAAFSKVKGGDDVKGADVGTAAAKRAPVNDDWSDED